MVNGTQVGPYHQKDVQGWIRAGYVNLKDPAWYEGCNAWVTVEDIPGINKTPTGHTVDGHLVPPFEAYDGDDPYIFVSYAHKDSEKIFKEISFLHDEGYNIWYDEGIGASSEWPEEIANAVIGCSIFLVFISPRSTASVNCRNEINLALNENKPFLAVYTEESVLPPGLRLRMGDLQAILSYKLPMERYQKKLKDALDQLLGRRKKSTSYRPNSVSATVFANAVNSVPRKRKKPQAKPKKLSRKRPKKLKIRTKKPSIVYRDSKPFVVWMILGIVIIIFSYGSCKMLEIIEKKKNQSEVDVIK